MQKSSCRSVPSRGRLWSQVPVALVIAALVGCGAPTPSEADPDDTGPAKPTVTRTAPTGPGHNDIDVDFAQMMIVHHRQAIEMSELAPEQGENPGVIALAEDIATVQAREIEALTALLDEWGEEVPDDIALDEMDHSEMDHEGIEMGFMAGMITEKQLADLATRQGEAFDRQYLKLMQTHHGGAIAMAYAERFRGENEDAVELATTMEQEQSDEIDEMKTLVHRLNQFD